MKFEINERIYSTIDENINPMTSFAERKLTLKILNDYKTFLTAIKMCDKLGFERRGNGLKIRKLITELILYHQVPIVSTNRGYKLTKDRNDLKIYAKSLGYRLLGLQRRIKSVNKIINSKKKIHSDWFIK